MSTAGDDGRCWLTVAQAAAQLGVSEKTVRKRIANGGVKAEHVTLPAGGWAWRVDASRLEAVGSVREAVGRREGSVTEHLEAVTVEKASVRENVPTASNRATELPTAPLPSVPSDAPIELWRELLAEKEARIIDLRTQLEAANRTAAEAHAALREALKLGARALPESTQASSTRNSGDGAQSAPQRQDAPGVSEGGARPNVRRKAAEREMRPLWKLILGVRH